MGKCERRKVSWKAILNCQDKPQLTRVLSEKPKKEELKTSFQYRRKGTSIVTIVATTLPLGPTAGLNFQPLPALIALSSSPRPEPFTTEMLPARQSVVLFIRRTTVPCNLAS